MSKQGEVVIEFTRKELAMCLFPLLLGAFVGMFSEMSLNIALSTLMREFSIEASTAQWLTTGYMLVISILLPVSAALLQWFQIRSLFLASVGIFAVGTLIAAAAANFEMLLAGRLVQAAGTGLQIPLIINTVLLIVPAEKRGSVMGMVGLVVLFAPAIAPTIAGMILNIFSWQWLFILILPFLGIAMLLGYVYIKDVSTLTKPRIDLLSVVLSSVGFGFLVYGLNLTGESAAGWSDARVVFSLAVGGGALLLFGARQARLDEPMLDLRVFCYPAFAIGAGLITISLLVLFSFLILIPLYLQNGLGLTAAAAGLIFLPGGVLNGFFSPVAGKMFDRFGPRKMAVPGMAITACSFYWASFFDRATSPAEIIVMHCLFMIGISMVIMPVQTNSVNHLPAKLYAHGTAALSTLQQLAGAAGTALCVSIMTIGRREYASGLGGDGAEALIYGVSHALFFAACMALVGVFLALSLKPAAKSPKKKNSV